jgi:hypothetical protein
VADIANSLMGSERQFTCALCKRQFVATNTVEDAMAEAKELYASEGIGPDDDIKLLCDGCYPVAAAFVRKRLSSV